MKYKIKWRDTKTGATGEGQPDSENKLQAWVDYANEKYPYIKHWIEEVKKEIIIKKETLEEIKRLLIFVVLPLIINTVIAYLIINR